MSIKLVSFTIAFPFGNVLENICILNRIADNLEEKECVFVGGKIDCFYKQNKIVSQAGDKETDFSFLVSLENCKDIQKTITETCGNSCSVYYSSGEISTNYSNRNYTSRFHTEKTQTDTK